jgi:catechol 2,3-dioxygenase-like lactoylglutathione lyase family enzyme
MPTAIHPVRVNHMNVVVEDIDACAARWRELYDAEFLADIPQREWRAGLVETGQVLFELFAPHEFLLNARYGPHYVGIEYQADMEEVREAIASHGLRIVRDIGLAVHTHPADGFGVAFEFYGGYFHDREWEVLGGAKMKSAAFWRDEHPLGLTGLKGYTVAVRDLDAASAFMRSFLAAEPVYEAPRPGIGGRALGLQVADAVLELVVPDGAGPLQAHLERFGEGIYSTVFGVRDLDRARRWFAARGVELAPGGATGSFAIPAAVNQGMIFEFAV